MYVGYLIGAVGSAVGALAEYYVGDVRQAIGFGVVAVLGFVLAAGYKTGKLPVRRRRRGGEEP